MKHLIIMIVIFTTLPCVGQQSITLDECYTLVTENYPLAKLSQLFESQNKLDKELIANSKLPQFSMDAQATYQSDVIEIPIPNTNSETLNKDQYRATVSVNQLIYNGGLTDAYLNVKSGQLKTKQKQLEVSIYQLKTQINQLYFSILLTQENYKLLEAKKLQLQTKLKEVQSGVRHGVLLPASDSVLEAELLKINQQFIEAESTKMSLIETLSSLIGLTLDNSIAFETPLIETQLQGEINRPELELFLLKKEEITNSEMLISKQNAPKLNGFANGGYGNPGLNMLDNSFQPFYTVGVKLHWNVFDWDSNKKQRKTVAINKDIIDNETDIFKLNTNIELNKQQKEIDKVSAFIVSDTDIIKLRKTILNTVDSQLKNGVITSSAYLTELTNLYEDENTLVKHKIQLQQAKANYNVIKGQ